MTWGPRLQRVLPRVAPFLFFPALVFEARVAWLAMHEPLGRDQGIFQYVAWALAHGQRDYVDLHDINGPFVHLVHFVMYAIGGRDELAIRAVDFVTSAVVFFLAGAVLPGIGWMKGDEPARAPWKSRVVWGLVGSALLWANYLKYNWWDHTQRESIYDLFVVAGLSLQLLALIPSAMSERTRAIVIAAASALAIMPSWGKPTCVLYLVGQGAALLLDDEAPIARRARLRAFVIGCFAGSLPIVLFLFFVHADIGAMTRMVLLDGPRFYRWVWYRSLTEAWQWGNSARLNYGVITFFALPVLVLFRLLPRRAWGAGFFAIAALVNFAIQHKYFPYHLHPITCSAFLVWLTSFAVLVERGPRARVRWIPGIVACVAAPVIAGLLCVHCVLEATGSDTAAEMTPDRLAAAATPELRAHALPNFYNGGSKPGGLVGNDYYPRDLRDAAAFVHDHTSATDRIQTWGNDPYVMFFAERFSATPYIYNFEINLDAAIAGGSGGAPGPREVEWLHAWSARAAHALFEDVAKSPPAAFVLMDNQPFDHPPDADADFAAHCPEAYAFMSEHYTRVRRFGAVRVWLRNDLAATAM